MFMFWVFLALKNIHFSLCEHVLLFFLSVTVLFWQPQCGSSQGVQGHRELFTGLLKAVYVLGSGDIRMNEKLSDSSFHRTHLLDTGTNSSVSRRWAGPGGEWHQAKGSEQTEFADGKECDVSKKARLAVEEREKRTEVQAESGQLLDPVKNAGLYRKSSGTP